MKYERGGISRSIRHTEFRAAEALQPAVWGTGDALDPSDLMMVIQAEGGLAAGAFVDGRLVGYVFGFPSATLGVQYSQREIYGEPITRGK
ncbi:hypothetical protein [Rhizobium mongolense]